MEILKKLLTAKLVIQLILLAKFDGTGDVRIFYGEHEILLQTFQWP